MRFMIDVENNITALEGDAGISANAQQFGSAKELGKLAADWPAERLVDIWNSLPGGKPVKKFTNRTTAVGRIWKAIQGLGPVTAKRAPTAARTKSKTGGRPTVAVRPATARDGSKKSEVIAMLSRKDGATLAAIMKATGWQAHSVRGFISGALIKKSGIKVESFKRENGERAYSIPS